MPRELMYRESTCNSGMYEVPEAPMPPETTRAPVVFAEDEDVA